MNAGDAMARIGRSVGRGGTNRPRDVVVIRYLLNGHARELPAILPLPVGNRCDSDLINAIVAFQSQIVGMEEPDGRVDPNGGTLRSLNLRDDQTLNHYYPEGAQAPLAAIARRYIGATERPGNRAGNDPRMQEIFRADYASPNRGATDGYAWCCSFVSLCTQHLIARNAIFSGVNPPREASVTRFRTLWAPAQNCLVFSVSDEAHSPIRGDIVVFTFSHIGIVESVGSDGVQTIEGNTNTAGSREGTTVMRKSRPYRRTRCFIRLPVPLTYDVENELCVSER